MYNCKSKYRHLNTCKNLCFIHNFIFTNPKIELWKITTCYYLFYARQFLWHDDCSHISWQTDISLGCTSQTPNREPSISIGHSVKIVRCTHLSQVAPHNRFPFTAEPDALTFTLRTSNYKFRCSFAHVSKFYTNVNILHLWAFTDLKWLHMNETISRPGEGWGVHHLLSSTTHLERRLGCALIVLSLARIFSVINSQKWQGMQYSRDKIQ